MTWPSIAVAFDALAWRAVPMPGSATPVRLARLPDLPDGAFRAFVRFPPGWSRTGAGHYPVAEEFLVLEGDLTLNDTTWHEGGYAWIPAHRVRADSRSESGCLAFAWFESAPLWVSGAPGAAALPDDVWLAHWRDAPELVPGGRRLHPGPEHQTWIVEPPHAAPLAAHEARWESLELCHRAWCTGAECAVAGDSTQAHFVRGPWSVATGATVAAFASPR